MNKPAPLQTTLRSIPRTASIALATMLSAACFRYQPASRPDGAPGDSPSADGAIADGAAADSTAMDAADTGVTEDAATVDSADVVGMDSVDDRPTSDVPTVMDVRLADASDASAVADARDGEAGACLPPDAGAPDGGGPIAAGDCAVNNGGCSQFAQCVSYCGGMRRCACAPGLTLAMDGRSCSGLLLLSKTSITMAGTNDSTISSFDPSISSNGRYVAFVSIVENTLSTYRCFSVDTRLGGAPAEIGATVDSMGVVQRPDACFAPHVTDDGRRALFVTTGLHPGDPEARPAWPLAVIATTRWPYYRDDRGAPTRVNVWQNTTFAAIHEEGFNNFRFARDGRRMGFACRTNLDPSVVIGDNNMDFYSASIPIQSWEPLFEDVNDDRSVPRNVLPFNARDMDMAGDSVTLIFGTPRLINGDRHPGTDVFTRRVGSRGMNPTINMSPDPDLTSTGNSRWPTGSFDGSKVLFVSNSAAVAGSSAQQYVISARSGGTVQFFPTGIPAGDPLASSMSDDGNSIVVITNRAYVTPGEPADTNGAYDYYLFDVSNPSTPRAVTRLGLTDMNLNPTANHGGPSQVRLAGDGNSVVFVTSQRLKTEDQNSPGPDVYLRVFR